MLDHPLSLFAPPYDQLQPLEDPSEIDRQSRNRPGVALLWNLQCPQHPGSEEVVQRRPGGVSLIIMLPEANQLERDKGILRIVEVCRPHSILPYHTQPNPTDLRSLLSRAPDDLAIEVSDYIAWRGVVIDPDTKRLVRRTIELSGELRSVTALSRSLYVSRRALGRRFLLRGLPVPSHWLHFGRILRASLRLQATEDTLFSIACDLGYPDGFALSNQMERLIGVRPTIARVCLGWEWILEAWMRQEAEHGCLAPADKSVRQGVRFTRQPIRKSRGTRTRP
jgi:AraC-like DNA-binding protein